MTQQEELKTLMPSLTDEQLALIVAQDQRFAGGIAGRQANRPEKPVWITEDDGTSVLRSTKLSDFLKRAIAQGITDVSPLITNFQNLNKSALPTAKEVELDVVHVRVSETPIKALYGQAGRYETGDAIVIVQYRTNKGTFIDSLPVIVNDPGALQERASDYTDAAPKILDYKGRGPLEIGDSIIVRQYGTGFFLGTDIENPDSTQNGILMYSLKGGYASRIVPQEFSITGSKKMLAKIQYKTALADMVSRAATAGIE